MDNVEFVSKAPPDYDFLSTLQTIPHIVGIDFNSSSFQIPYLHADPTLINHWENRLPSKGYRIGIAWQGNALPSGRSIPLTSLAPLSRIPGVQLISLQMNEGMEQLDGLPDGMIVSTLGPEFNAGPDNFVDTAAVMKNLDLILTIDTSVAHLAGALGCPVWVMLKSDPDWRWLRDREDSPWYPTMRLFRQNANGDWDDVIGRVVDALNFLRRDAVL